MKNIKRTLAEIMYVIFVLFCAINQRALAQTGSATAEAISSDIKPDVGVEIQISIVIDVTGVDAPDNLLGAFDCKLTWDTSIFSYVSDVDLLGGFSGAINRTNVTAGELRMSATNVSGASGRVTVFTTTLSVQRVDYESTTLDLDFTSMAAAGTFKSLLSILTVSPAIITDVRDGEGQNELPEKFELLPNYPNPFNPETIIKYQTPKKGRVTLTIHNLAGQKLITLVDQEVEAGSYSIVFEGSNLASGVYFYILKAGTFIKARKMLLIR